MDTEEANFLQVKDEALDTGGGEPCDESVASSSTSSSTSTDVDDSQASQSFAVATEETELVNTAKRVLLLVIFALAILCSATLFFLLQVEDHSDFVDEFRHCVANVKIISSGTASKMLEELNSMGDAITSFVSSTEADWPNVTIPDFEVLASRITNNFNETAHVMLSPLVKHKQKNEWESYSIRNQGWIDNSHHLAHILDIDIYNDDGFPFNHERDEIPHHLYSLSDQDSQLPAVEPSVTEGPFDYAPVWQLAPVPHETAIVNLDILSHEPIFQLYSALSVTRNHVVSAVLNLQFLYGSTPRDDSDIPRSLLLFPIFKSLKPVDEQGPEDLVAFLTAEIPWGEIINGMTALHTDNIFLVVHNNCGDLFTYNIEGGNAKFLGHGDFHDPYYDYLLELVDFEFSQKNKNSNEYSSEGHCDYSLWIYPSATFENDFKTDRAAIYSIVCFSIFLLTTVVFFIYDFSVAKRNRKVLASARRTDAIISSLFPKDFRDRILNDNDDADENHSKWNGRSKGMKALLNEFVHDNAKDGDSDGCNSKPIADLFPETTVMFADIYGFSAWSSEREAFQIFTLLEKIYSTFDRIANRRRVFKVETIGDMYVAVCGLPDARKEHATIMCRFARDCLNALPSITGQLDKELGPGTSSLTMRFGLHSGPTTAGVLRGQNRFQLFGDTVGTAAIMQATSLPGRVQLSEETAQLVMRSKPQWITKRDDIISVKGKGALLTYWLDIKTHHGSASYSGSSLKSDNSAGSDDIVRLYKPDGPNVQDISHENGLDIVSQRIVDYNVEVLTRLLEELAMRRSSIVDCHQKKVSWSLPRRRSIQQPTWTVIDEVIEIIDLPTVEDNSPSGIQRVSNKAEKLDPGIVEQLKDLLTRIALRYNCNNPFHNFEHAGHVAMSVVKLLGRIVVSSEDNDDDAALQKNTFGIRNPLTRFACVFSALIHDVDHRGLPNARLAQEQDPLAAKYNDTSILEQNSVDIAWEIFMDPKYERLRRQICANDTEMNLFRQLVVNSVMATDIVDKKLKEARNARWCKAFDPNTVKSNESMKDRINRQGTIVIEHLIQASDIAHTMQHYYVYRKWNQRFFFECYKAYKEGHAETDPSENWYKGEIGFFDFYIIPLAKKLKDCAVFGVSSDEYLNYAMTNRREWERNGEGIVAEMLEQYYTEFPDKSNSPLEETPASPSRKVRMNHRINGAA